MIKVCKMGGEYNIRKDGWTQLQEYFPTIESLENHIKLMLIAVQTYKENGID